MMPKGEEKEIRGAEARLVDSCSLVIIGEEPLSILVRSPGVESF